MQTVDLQIKLLRLLGLVLLCGISLVQADAQSPKPLPAVLEVPFAPIQVKAMDKMTVAYELHITNFSRANLVLTGVEVLSGDARATSLASYRDAELLKRLLVITGATDSQEKNVIGGGQRAIVFLMISADVSSAPSALRHRLFFKPTDAEGGDKEQTVEGMRVAVQNGKPFVIGAPFRGRWIAVNGLSNDTGHRRSIIPIGGAARIPQRFATDWVKLGDDGLVARNGDLSQNANYYTYGAETLAVADGVVVDIKDGIPDNVPQTKARAVPITLETIGGNYVLLDIGNGRFALYAHLQSGSLKVKVGDKVKLGQILGLVGNSGNSDLPHLHFHIVNAASPLAAEGVPYVFKSFVMQGALKSNAEIIKGGFKPDPDTASKRQMEIPIQNAIIVFE
ncbi:MAG TPA: M23 family metallopeptidase [Pyrinomonadaceae bacterium]